MRAVVMPLLDQVCATFHQGGRRVIMEAEYPATKWASIYRCPSLILWVRPGYLQTDVGAFLKGDLEGVAITASHGRFRVPRFGEVYGAQ